MMISRLFRLIIWFCWGMLSWIFVVLIISVRMVVSLLCSI